MGLTSESTGRKAVDEGLVIQKQNPEDRVIALAGNPNVGKSTVFNELTGLNQHTGNWPGKTVTNAQGFCTYKDRSFVMVDIPGSYSLMAHSAEEEVARDFICFGSPDAVIVVCDATCLERNLNLVLQTIEITDRVVVCVNLMDEAKRKGIQLDLNLISNRLGVPVIPAVARTRNSLDELMQAVCGILDRKEKGNPVRIQYGPVVEQAISMLEPVLDRRCGDRIPSRWLALKLLDSDESLTKSLDTYLGYDIRQDPEIEGHLVQARKYLQENGVSLNALQDLVVSSLVQMAEKICRGSIGQDTGKYHNVDRKIDKILTSKWTGFPIMLLLLAVIFWLTISGANMPSQILADGLFWFQDRLTDFFLWLGTPEWIHDVLVLGVYRVLAWVVTTYRYPIPTRLKIS